MDRIYTAVITQGWCIDTVEVVNDGKYSKYEGERLFIYIDWRGPSGHRIFSEDLCSNRHKYYATAMGVP